MSVTPVKAGGIEKKEINQQASTSTLTSVPVVALALFIFVSRENPSRNSASLSVVDEINAA